MDSEVNRENAIVIAAGSMKYPLRG